MKGVGVYWSWQRGGGQAYNGNGFNGIDDTTALLVGWVNPKSVNWVDTLSINAYMENSETELRLLKNDMVEIDKVLVDGKNILKKPMLVRI